MCNHLFVLLHQLTYLPEEKVGQTGEETGNGKPKGLLDEIHKGKQLKKVVVNGDKGKGGKENDKSGAPRPNRGGGPLAGLASAIAARRPGIAGPASEVGSNASSAWN
jgi:hypothetical protein